MHAHAHVVRRVAATLLAALTIAACSGGDTTGDQSGAGAGTSTPAPAATDGLTPQAPAPGAPCDTEGAQTGMEGGTLECTSTNGTLTWQVMTDGGEGAGEGSGEGNGEGTSGGDPSMIVVGQPCATDGAFGFRDGGLTICDGGTGRYAMPDDLPPAPAGGYTARPDWYPTLAQMFGASVDECSGEPVQFTHPIVPTDQLAPSMPHGMMIGDHVTPIDHMYIGIATLLADPATLTDDDYLPVTAPAAGTIVEAGSLGSPTSHRVTISHGCGIVSVYMVVNRLTGPLAEYAERIDAGETVMLDIPIAAGDEFGRQRDNPLDFNIFTADTWLPGLANPYSYAFGEAWKPYTADPFPYFTPEVGGPLEASLQRLTEPRWGPIDYDIAGTASGSWFLDGTIGYSGGDLETYRTATSMVPGGGITGRTSYAYGHLALAPHPVDTARWIFSIGAWPTLDGAPRQLLIDLAVDQPTPADLTAASGPVVYRLTDIQVVQPPGYTRPPGPSPDGIGYTLAPGSTVGWVVVEVRGDQSLAIEIVADPAAQPTGFTGPGTTYHR